MEGSIRSDIIVVVRVISVSVLYSDSSTAMHRHACSSEASIEAKGTRSMLLTLKNPGLLIASSVTSEQTKTRPTTTDIKRKKAL